MEDVLGGDSAVQFRSTRAYSLAGHHREGCTSAAGAVLLCYYCTGRYPDNSTLPKSTGTVWDEHYHCPTLPAVIGHIGFATCPLRSFWLDCTAYRMRTSHACEHSDALRWNRYGGAACLYSCNLSTTCRPMTFLETAGDPQSTLSLTPPC